MMKFRNFAAVVAAAGMILGMTGCSGSSPTGNVTANLIKSPVSGTSAGGEEMASRVVAVELADGDKVAEIELEGYGTIKAKLFPDIAPIGVQNFIDLAEEGYYDGLKIHRVVADFMMQGGSLNGDGTGGNAKTESTYFDIEPDKSARHFYGALCYANAMGRNTTQFYIVNNHISQDITELNVENINNVVSQFEEILQQCEAGSTEYTYYKSQMNYYKNLADFVGTATEDVKRAYAEVGGTPVLDGGYTVFGQVFEGYDIIDKISRVEVTTNSSGEESKPLEDIIIKTVRIVDYKAPTEEEAANSDSAPTSSDTSSESAADAESKVQTIEAEEKN